jgi:hypothetical protein
VTNIHEETGYFCCSDLFVPTGCVAPMTRRLADSPYCTQLLYREAKSAASRRLASPSQHASLSLVARRLRWAAHGGGSQVLAVHDNWRLSFTTCW